LVTRLELWKSRESGSAPPANGTARRSKPPRGVGSSRLLAVGIRNLSSDFAATVAAGLFVVWARAIWYNPAIEVAMTLTPELKQAVERAGDEPVRVEDPDTHTAYVVIKEDVYRKLREAVPESDITLHEFEDLISFE
jgi:hypothetical protein